MDALGFMIGGLLALFVVAMVVGGVVLWIVALVECARRPDDVYRAAGTEKTSWVLVVALAGLIGALIYWFSVRAQLRAVEAAHGGYAALRPPEPPGAMAVPPTPPGWYPAPGADGQLRWWDGGRWTDHVS